jgi:hypothetical protein
LKPHLTKQVGKMRGEVLGNFVYASREVADYFSPGAEQGYCGLFGVKAYVNWKVALPTT